MEKERIFNTILDKKSNSLSRKDIIDIENSIEISGINVDHDNDDYKKAFGYNEDRHKLIADNMKTAVLKEGKLSNLVEDIIGSLTKLELGILLVNELKKRLEPDMSDAKKLISILMRLRRIRCESDFDIEGLFDDDDDE